MHSQLLVLTETQPNPFARVSDLTICLTDFEVDSNSYLTCDWPTKKLRKAQLNMGWNSAIQRNYIPN